ncbi:MAG: bifunctional precorrin-2 dehydrogenase/sirohydrochlorin ferrochelatase [Crocinitomicaceae bacterium]|nr:bifunctional precorrin-2 dehydrogenase/sirohydrochlorin ferrochelatase [Crocinitomicaceae bacterium]
MNELFPIFLKADKINFLIVGGGKVALEKLFFLQKSSPNAKIELVALEILPEVFELLKKFPESKLFHRAFSIDDLADKQIVIAATNNPLLNQRLRDLADQYKFLLNVADKPEYCDFYLGGIVTRGDLKIGISTNGKSPVLAKRIRQWLEAVLPDSIEKAISLNHRLRKKQKGNLEEKVRKLNKLTEGLIKD